MNIVDSSGWLEYFADGPNASSFEKPLLDLESLIIPIICFYEVFKAILRERGEDAALQAIALLKQAKVVDLSLEIAIQAAKISIEHKIPMADSIILATAQTYEATIWTQDDDFQNFKGVKYFRRKKA